MTLTEDCCLPDGDPTHPATIEHIERYRFASNYANQLEILDIACGAGYGAYMLLKEGKAKSVLGVDYSQKNVDYCRQKYKAVELSFVKGDICNLNLNKQFDLIVCYETIEHVESYRSALICLHSALKNDGKLIISSPNRKITNPYLGPDIPTMDGAHKREFTPNELLEELSKINFKEVGYFGQRVQRYFTNLFIEKQYQRIFHPSRKASPVVTKITHLEPQYFVFILTK